MAFPSTFVDIQNDVIARARLDSSLDLNRTKDAINQAYYDIAVETEAIISTTTISCVAGTTNYTLASTVARIREMTLTPAGSTQTQPPLTRTTLDEIIQRRKLGGDTQQSGSYVTHYALLGHTRLEVWPTPAAADTINVWYVAFPTALSADADVPVLQEPWVSRLLTYGALVQIGDFKGDPALPDWERNFEIWKGRYADHLKRKGGVVPAQFHQWGDGSGFDVDVDFTYAGGW